MVKFLETTGLGINIEMCSSNMNSECAGLPLFPQGWSQDPEVCAHAEGPGLACMVRYMLRSTTKSVPKSTNYSHFCVLVVDAPTNFLHTLGTCRLTVYGYWNEGGKSNVVEMMLYIVSRFFSSNPITPAPPISTPPTGCLHPDYDGYFETPKQYLAWYKQNGALRGTKAPVAAVLLYRKHVVTGQNYIQQLVRQMETEGVIPIPIFLNGVEVRPRLGCAHAILSLIY